MVGHLLEDHAAITVLVEQGELGKLKYIYSNRLNMGKVRQEEDALWSFASYDISVIGRDGWRVLKVLAASQRSLTMNWDPVQLEPLRSLDVVRG